jgi:hypothetical protein
VRTTTLILHTVPVRRQREKPAGRFLSIAMQTLQQQRTPLPSAHTACWSPVHCPRKLAVRSARLMNEELPGGLRAAVGCGECQWVKGVRNSSLVLSLSACRTPASPHPCLRVGCPSHRGMTPGHMNLGATRRRLGLSESINCVPGREATWVKFGSQA